MGDAEASVELGTWKLLALDATQALPNRSLGLPLATGANAEELPHGCMHAQGCLSRREGEDFEGIDASSPCCG